MAGEVTVPAFPESINDGTLVAWRKRQGDPVKRGEILADIETDKVVFEVPAPEDGVLEDVAAAEGATVLSGQIIARVMAGAPAKATKPAATAAPPKPTAVRSPEPASKPPAGEKPTAMPAARRLAAERGVNLETVSGSGRGGRVLKEDVLRQATASAEAARPESASTPGAAAPPAQAMPAPVTELPELRPEERPERRVAMTRLRARIAERLVEAQRNAAMLTTFNEVNMLPVTELRNRYRERFEKQHGVRLGFMSFFVKAAVEALKRFPEVNASIDGHDVVYHGYYDIGIAVASPRGLVVPVLRDADRFDMADIEARIKEYADKAQAGTLAIDEITGGTFTITNGGVFGSLLSTPILNPPQSAILGMHRVQDRPVAENGQVVVRPMMYLALSYDHRLIDGREAVRFLVTIKELIEDPARLLLGV